MRCAELGRTVMYNEVSELGQERRESESATHDVGDVLNDQLLHDVDAVCRRCLVSEAVHHDPHCSRKAVSTPSASSCCTRTIDDLQSLAKSPFLMMRGFDPLPSLPTSLDMTDTRRAAKGTRATRVSSFRFDLIVGHAFSNKHLHRCISQQGAYICLQAIRRSRCVWFRSLCRALEVFGAFGSRRAAED